MRPPNLLLLITDQQRRPRHWPEDSGWLAELMPNEAELARTGLTFRNGFCNTSMCSPSRATLFTGLYPAHHGVHLTLTAADLKPDPRHTPAVVADLARLLRRRGAPRGRALRQFVAGALGLGPKGGGEPELKPSTPNLAQMLRAAGYTVGFKGKWHLTQPVGEDGWSERDAQLLDEGFGFAGWEPPDAGENAKAENFGGGTAGPLGEGWDEVYTRQAEAWLGRADLPEPFCLIVSLVNPHDVLGYASSYEEGGYDVSEFRGTGVGLPPTIDEDLSSKPSVQSHGEMGLSHGGLRQKAFNAYEETINVPLVVSNPLLFSRAAETDALASLIDVLPTMATLGGAAAPPGAQGADLSPLLARHASAERAALDRAQVDLAPVLDHPAPAGTVRDSLHFTYDDHQAVTARADAPGQPNRVRSIRDSRTKYTVYLDPRGRAAPEYEMYDLERDPDERLNLLDPRTGEPCQASARGERDRLAEALKSQMSELGTDDLAP